MYYVYFNNVLRLFIVFVFDKSKYFKYVLYDFKLSGWLILIDRNLTNDINQNI